MADFSVGDKVKFLNAPGGGVISKVIDSKMVNVMIEDGFELPTLVTELIKTGLDHPAARFFEQPLSQGIPEVKEPEDTTTVEKETKLPASVKQEGKSGEIFLAFVPHDQQWLITGMVDVCLINNTPFDLIYNVFSRNPEGRFEGMDYGSLFPSTRFTLATIDREQLIRWTEGAIQFLFHKEQTPEPLPPFNSEYTIDAKKFLKEGSYRYHPAIQSKGIVVRILSLTDHFNQTGFPLHEQPEEKTSVEKEEEEFIMKYQVAPRVAEVDLHIHELVEDPANLEKGEILNFQRAWFHRCLNSAIKAHFLKVVFIHGTGNGILRNVLLTELGSYHGIEFYDAPMARYGVGAMEVKIPHNN